MIARFQAPGSALERRSRKLAKKVPKTSPFGGFAGPHRVVEWLVVGKANPPTTCRHSTRAGKGECHVHASFRRRSGLRGPAPGYRGERRRNARRLLRRRRRGAHDQPQQHAELSRGVAWQGG